MGIFNFSRLPSIKNTKSADGDEYDKTERYSKLFKNKMQ